jgi:hypothetical protein
MTSDRGLRASIGLCAVVIVVTALYFSGTVFAPLAFALLIIALIWPVQKRLQARLPKLVALAVSMLVTVVILTAFGSLIAWGFSRVGRYIVGDAARFQMLYGQMADWLEGHGIVVAGLWAEHFNVAWLIRLFQEITSRLNSTLTFTAVVLIYVILGLLEVDAAAGKLGTAETGEFGRVLLAGGARTAAKFRRYMLVRSLMSVMTGLLVWGFAALVGLPLAAEWGVIAFALNYIPFIPVRGDGVSDLDRHRTIRILADGGHRVRVSQSHSVPGRKLSRAANRRQRTFHLAVPGAVRGVLLDLRVGGRRRVHRRADRHRGPDAVRAAPVQPVGCGFAGRPRRRAGVTRPVGWVERSDTHQLARRVP